MNPRDLCDRFANNTGWHLITNASGLYAESEQGTLLFRLSTTSPGMLDFYDKKTHRYVQIAVNTLTEITRMR
jgi:hypothetical protein